MTDLKKTALHADHIQLKARMVPFGGWDMPVQYAGLMQEHQTVREHVGLFDVSHMGEFVISGPKARDFLQRVTTNDISKLYDGRCQYNLLCYPQGTVVDDLIISQISNDEYLAVVNASNIDKDFSWLSEQNQEGVDLKNISDDYSLIAIQGPQAQALTETLLDIKLGDLKYYHFLKLEHQGVTLQLSRTGYTGEDGFELMMPNQKASYYWTQLLELGQKHKVQAIGLGARDTLRLEAAYSLYGHEISDQINPLEAKLGWIIKLDKGDFIGREALLKSKEEGLKNKLVGFEMQDPGVARDGYSVWIEDEKKGFVTSGTHSPSLKKSIGLALIDKNFADQGQDILIDIRGKKKKAVVIPTPFIKKT